MSHHSLLFGLHFLFLVISPLGMPQDEPTFSLPQLIQETSLEKSDATQQLLEDPHLVSQLRFLAKALIKHKSVQDQAPLLLRLQSLLSQDAKALKTLLDWRTAAKEPFSFMAYELYLRAAVKSQIQKQPFDTVFSQVFDTRFSAIEGRNFVVATRFLGFSLVQAEHDLKLIFQQLQKKETLDADAAMKLLLYYQDYRVHQTLLPKARSLIKKEENRRFSIDDQVMITTKDGATLSATLVQPKPLSAAPTLMQFSIYTDPQRNKHQAIDIASRGYIAVIADARGKRLSQDPIQPYETEAGDVNAVIDWICKQPWSDGRVGMFGGSYLGFTQWAATKNLHPALKTIVPSAAAIPGLGLPMENNIFLNANYGWAFHVTNNRLMDHTIYQDQSRWDRLNQQYYQQGIAYRQIDTLDKKRNPWLQRWLKHPDYDAFWQNMVPFRSDFAQIDIPVLSFTGYYDDGQISAIHYVAEHFRYHQNPEHYLVIGPYDHFTTQNQPAETLRGYRLDPVAHIHVPELTYAWMDYIFKGHPKPALLKNRVNYQVMGTNRWQHASSLDALHQHSQRYYFSNEKSQELKGTQEFRLVTQPSTTSQSVLQTVDLSDRSQQHHDYYPWPIIRKKLEVPNGLAFISHPLAEDMIFAGRFSGELKVTINKKDMDAGLVLYEWLPDGTFFHLSYFLGRASYAEDMTQRHLLVPGKLESIPFHRTRMVARKLSKGSRIILLASVNVNAFAQVNYGTGKDVSDESIADAGEPLEIQWHNTSYIDLPMQTLTP